MVNFKAMKNEGNIRLDKACIGKCARLTVANQCSGFAEVKSVSGTHVDLQWISEIADRGVLHLSPQAYDTSVQYDLKDIDCTGIHDMDKGYMSYRREKSKSQAKAFNLKRIEARQADADRFNISVDVDVNYQYE